MQMHPQSAPRMKVPRWALLAVGLAAAAFAVIYLTVHSRASAKTGTEILTIFPGTHHLGDDYRDDAAEAKVAEGIHIKTSFVLDSRPRKATLTMESSDVDLDGCEIWINNQHLGDFTQGTDWHAESFELPRGMLVEGENKVLIRAKVWSSNQSEDFFFRKARLTLTY